MSPLRRNSLILFLSEGTSSVLMMATGFVVARLLNVADFGKFTSALAFASIIAVLVDSGMGMVAAKDIARAAGSHDRDQLNQIFTWRMAVIVVASLATPLAAWILLPGGDVRRLAVGLTPGVLLVGTTDFFCWLFKGAQKAIWCAGLQLTSRLLLLILSVIALAGPRPLTGQLIAYLIAGASMTLLGLYVLGRSMHVLELVRPPAEFFRRTLPDIYKMGAILILSVIFTRADLMLVARFRGDAEAGLFGAAGRILDAVRLIPMVVYSVFLPAFAAAHDQPQRLRSQFKVAHDLLLVLSITIALLGCAFAVPLFRHLLGPQYVDAVACFKPLAWSCVLMFSNILMFSLLYAINAHRSGLIGISGALVVELVLDAAFVPHFGIVAAAWSRLVAECFNFLMMAGGLLRSGVLISSGFFLRPIGLAGTAAILLWVLGSQPMAFQFAFSWTMFLGLAVTLGLGRRPKEATS
jgi:O-antigen/teichoic acid export membrane protein